MAAPIKEIKRDKNLYIQVTAKEKEEIIAKAKRSVCSNTSEYIRDALLNERYRILTVDQDLLNRNDILLQQVRNIGSNFNQLLKVLHSKKLNYFTNDDILKMNNSLSDIKDIYNKIETYFQK